MDEALNPRENLDKLHTTSLGIERIQKNLLLKIPDVIGWCREKTASSERIELKGKNWYVYSGDYVITVNARSFTVITAHKSDSFRVKSISVKTEPHIKPMRRNDREVTDYSGIVDILRRADTIRLGLNGEPYPYVVPLSFGYEAVNGKITIYIHGAKEGLKHDLIRQNPYVCTEADILHRYASSGANVTAEYESFIGFGKAERVTGDEFLKALDLLLLHCGYDGFEYDRTVLNFTSVYKIELSSFKGKRRFLPSSGE